MFREVIAPRSDWFEQAEMVGFNYHTQGKDPSVVPGVYWYEGACYRFSMAQVEAIEEATNELHRICLQAVDHIVQTPGLIERFGIPASYHDYIRRSWCRPETGARDPHLMGRFDLAFDPATSAVKMLEYNADTPTLAIETGIVQWHWMEQVRPKTDQFNSLHERLIEQFRGIAPRLQGETLYFASLGGAELDGHPDRPWSLEEYQHSTYFRDLAEQAGIRTTWIDMADIGYDPNHGFLDLAFKPIRFMHKLYPWEWMAAEPFGDHATRDLTGFVEPVWKMLLSNKAILPILWQMFPHHPNLLAAYSSPENPLVKSGRFVEKPILAREGANIRMVQPGLPEIKTTGTYGNNQVVYQDLVQLPKFEGQHVVIGSWVVGDEAAGMILREAPGPIVVDSSRVMPHYIKG